MKTRLSMETFRDIDTVISYYTAGRLSASKCRGLVERIIYEGLEAENIDPLEYGGSETDRVYWACLPGQVTIVEVIAERLEGMTRQRVAEICSRLLKQGRLERVAYGAYRRKQ